MMSPEFYKFVEEAKAITTSGRLAAINENIQEVSANQSIDNSWWVQVFASLSIQLFREYVALKQTYFEEGSETSLLAWRARNLLELSIWCQYCSTSRENAHRFYEDVGRDVIGILDAFMKWSKAIDRPASDPHAFTNARQALEEQAALKGIVSLSGSYKKVRNAAIEIGMGDNFDMSYKMLSKFAHPTAMLILAPHNATTEWRDVFFSHGCLFFTGAFTALEISLIQNRS